MSCDSNEASNIVLLLPARVWMALFFAAPLGIVCAYSFLTRGDYGGVEQPWTFESFTRLADPLYLAILWRSVWIASLATVLCALLGFPLALFISRAGPRKNLYLQLVLLPFWTSFLVRTYAWLFILRDTGLINTVLLHLHFIATPLQLLYNDGAVLVGLVYNFLPFFVLPMYATLERLDPALLEAAADLGARSLRTLWRVIIPVSAPGFGGWRGACVYPLPGRLPDTRPSRRRQNGDARKSGAESVHDGAGLAVRVGGVAGFDAGERSASGGVDAEPNGAGVDVRQRALGIYSAIVLAFLHAPLLILIVFSFNASRFTVWEGFSLRWYRAAMSDPQLAEGLVNSLIIAVVAAVLSTVIGTLGAYGMWRRAAPVLSGALYLSLVTPEIVTGVSLLALFQWVFRFLHLQLGIYTVIIAHVAFSIAYVTIVISARLRNYDRTLEEAAMDLGASEWHAFSRVTLPYLAPAIAAAGLLALVVSFDDYVITSLVAGVDSETLPMVIYAMARRGVSPVVNAVSALIVVAFGAIILISQRLQER